jgi:5'-hydroxyaverantin dehydrogenase
VTIADVQDAAGQRVAADLTAKGAHVSYVHCDTTDWRSSVAAFKHAASFAPSKTLDVAALFAGIEGDKGSLTDQVLAAPEPSLDVDAVPAEPPHLAIQVNLSGLYKNAWLALYYMRLPSQGAGTAPTSSKSLILISSMAGYSDMPTNTDYNASKCKSPDNVRGGRHFQLTSAVGVRGIFRGLRHTTAPLNVRVNLMAPFWVNTPLVQPKMKEMAAAGIAPGKGLTWCDIDDVVSVATKCATDPNTSGRAFVIAPEGYSDLNDDEAGGWAGDALREQYKIRRAGGDRVG